METRDEGGDIVSQQCSNCDGSSARCWCLDCNEALCEACISAHRRVTLTRSHRLLNQPPNDHRSISPTKFCRVHPSEPLKLFCFTCNQLTCRDCQLTAHKNHRFNFVTEAVESLRKQLDACMQPIRAQMEASKTSLKDMERRLSILTHCESKLTGDLQQVFRILVQRLTTRREFLTKQIQKVYGFERELIKGRMLKVKQLQESHRSVCEAAEKAQKATELPELVTHVGQITSRVKDLVDRVSSPPPTMTHLRVVTDRNSVEGLSQFGKLDVSWIPFSVSQDLRTVETAPASSSSSCSSSSSPSSVTPPTTSQPLTHITTTSNSRLCPVPPTMSSTTSSSSPSDSSSGQCRPPRTSSSDSSSSTLLFSHPAVGHCTSVTRPAPSGSPSQLSLHPASASRSSSVPTSSCPSDSSSRSSSVPTSSCPSDSSSRSSSVPTSSCPLPSNSNLLLLQSGEVCDSLRAPSSHLSVTPPSSTFNTVAPSTTGRSSPSSTCSIPRTTEVGAPVPISLSSPLVESGSSRSSRSSRSSPPPSSMCSSCVYFHKMSVTTPHLLHLILGGQSDSTGSSSAPRLSTCVTPSCRFFSKIPSTKEPEPSTRLKTTKEPEPSTSRLKTTKEPEPSTRLKTTKEPEPSTRLKTTKEPEPSTRLKTTKEPEPSTRLKTTKEPEPSTRLKTTKEPEPSTRLKTTKEPEPSTRLKTTKEPDSTIQINVLTKSQLEETSGQFHFHFRWKKHPKSSKSSKSSRSSRSSSSFSSKTTEEEAGPVVPADASVSRPSAGPSLVQNQSVVVLTDPPVSSSSSSSSSVAPSNSSSASTWQTFLQPVCSSSVGSVGSVPLQLTGPSLSTNPTCPLQQPVVLNQQPFVNQNHQSVVLLTNHQTAGPSSRPSFSSSTASTYMILPQVVSSSAQAFVAGPSPPCYPHKPVQVSVVLNQQAGPGQNQPAVVVLPNMEDPQTMSVSSVGVPSVLAGVQNSQLGPVLLDLPAVPGTSAETGPSVSPSEIKRSSFGSINRPASCQDLDSTRTGPSILNSLQQTEGLKVTVGSSVQHQEVDQRVTTVSEPEPEPGPETLEMDQTGDLTIVSPQEDNHTERPASQEPDGSQPIRVTSEEIDDMDRLFSPISSEDELLTSEEPDLSLKLSSSETSDSESEEPLGTKTGPQDSRQVQWQPRVSLVRLPVSVPGGRPLPRFHFIPGDDEVLLQEVEEESQPSPPSPASGSVEVVSCSACSSPDASRICSACGRGYHRGCHVPPVGPDVRSEWICSLCQNLSDPSDPYSRDRPSPRSAGLSLQDQRRCETLLLHLKVEGCAQFSEVDLWSDLTMMSERLSRGHPDPYQSADQLVSDLWTLFQGASQDDALDELQQSFQKKLEDVLGAELHPSLLIGPKTDELRAARGPNGSVSSRTGKKREGSFTSGSKLKDLRKRLRDFLDLKTTPGAKRTKKS